ncbi:MAG: ATP-binding protein [Paracoccaceae bacterium]
MNFSWLKRYVPRGLYGRAALILLLPVITLQVVVSVVFIQRHFEDVTQQMTRNLAFDLRLVRQEIDAAESLSAANARLAQMSGVLQFNILLPAKHVPDEDSRRFFDLSGRIVVSTLHNQLDAVRAVDLLENRNLVNLWLNTRHGVVKIWLNRNQVSASNPHQFLVLMIFVGALMTLVAFIFLRNQLRPIKRLARAAEAFGRGRSVEYRPAGALEVRSAGNAFLDMRARIERQIEQRTMMLSGVSHDLRTPLTRFKLGVSMLDSSADTADLERDIADMERLLDAFLAFAKDDALDDPQEIDPETILQVIVGKFSGVGGAVNLGECSGKGRVMLRPMAIERALENLIGNGLRYGDQVSTSVTITEKSVKFTVEDDGPGIAKKLRDEALKPFVRLDTARNQDQGSGVGLGLSIAHDIARRHGGTLRLGKSKELGGLLVDLVLPR